MKILRKSFTIILCLLLFISFMTLTAGCNKVDEDTIIYKILQLTNPQFSSLDQKTIDSISTMITTSTPDLIVITGNLVDDCLDNGILYQQFIDFLDTFTIPYAIVFGNNDTEGSATKEELAAILKSGKYSLFEEGPEDISGIGNYIVNVPNPNGGTAWSLFMLDSNEYIDSGYDCIHLNQVEWYCNSINNIKESNNGTLNALAFFHTPLPEYQTAWKLRNTEEVIYHFGDKREAEGHSQINTGLFQVMACEGSTKGVFVGNDQINDYSVTYQGVRLTYGLKTKPANSTTDNLSGGLLISLTVNDFNVEQLLCN